MGSRQTDIKKPKKRTKQKISDNRLENDCTSDTGKVRHRREVSPVPKMRRLKKRFICSKQTESVLQTFIWKSVK